MNQKLFLFILHHLLPHVWHHCLFTSCSGCPGVSFKDSLNTEAPRKLSVSWPDSKKVQRFEIKQEVEHERGMKTRKFMMTNGNVGHVVVALFLFFNRSCIYPGKNLLIYTLSVSRVTYVMNVWVCECVCVHVCECMHWWVKRGMWPILILYLMPSPVKRNCNS